MHVFQAIRNVFVSPGFERRKVIWGYCDEITRPAAAFALESVSPHHIQCCAIFGHSWGRLDRLGDIVVNDALLVCLGGIWGFTWMNLGSSFFVKWWSLKGSQLHTRVATKIEHTYFIQWRVQGLYIYTDTVTRHQPVRDSLTFNGKPNCQRKKFAAHRDSGLKTNSDRMGRYQNMLP